MKSTKTIKSEQATKTMGANSKTAAKKQGSETMTSRNQVIAVVIRQYGSGLYRTCVSLDKDDVTFLSTHKDERSANETISLFWQAYDEGQLKTQGDVESFIKAIQPQEPKTPTTPPPVTPFPNQRSNARIPVATIPEQVEQYFTPLAA